MVTDLDLDNGEGLHGFSRESAESFKNMLCTTWGLLLRCYTGQGNISFHFHQGNVDESVSNPAAPRGYHSTFRMEFHEQESLSTCVARAKDAYANAERKGPSLVSPESDVRSLSASHEQNTHVWVRSGTQEDTQDGAVQKVC